MGFEPLANWDAHPRTKSLVENCPRIDIFGLHPCEAASAISKHMIRGENTEKHKNRSFTYMKICEKEPTFHAFPRPPVGWFLIILIVSSLYP